MRKSQSQWWSDEWHAIQAVESGPARFEVTPSMPIQHVDGSAAPTGAGWQAGGCVAVSLQRL